MRLIFAGLLVAASLVALSAAPDGDALAVKQLRPVVTNGFFASLTLNSLVSPAAKGGPITPSAVCCNQDPRYTGACSYPAQTIDTWGYVSPGYRAWCNYYTGWYDLFRTSCGCFVQYYYRD